jgi:hypothetical protein
MSEPREHGALVMDLVVALEGGDYLVADDADFIEDVAKRLWTAGWRLAAGWLPPPKPDCSLCEGRGYAYQCDDPEDHSIPCECRSDAVLAAGWLPPEEAEALREETARTQRKNDEQYRTLGKYQQHMDTLKARIAVLESSWIPPERVEEIDCPVKFFRKHAPSCICRGSGKLRIEARMTEPESYVWDPDGQAVDLRDKVLNLTGTSGILGTTSDGAWEALTDSGRHYVEQSIELIAEWAQTEKPVIAVECVLSQALLAYQILHGAPSPWESS